MMPNTADIATQAGDTAPRVKALTAEQVADHIGVTPHSDMRPWVVQAVKYARECDAALEPQEAEPAKVCTWCKGKGVEADYAGYDMKCVPVSCSACNGTGLVPVTASDERAVEAVEKLRRQVAAAHPNHKTMFVYVDDLRAALAAAPKAQPVQGWQDRAFERAMWMLLRVNAAQYLLSNTRSRANGAAKAVHHEAMTNAYVAAIRDVDPDRVRRRYEADYKAVHDATAAELTDRLDEAIGFEIDGYVKDEWIDRFLSAFHLISLRALPDGPSSKEGQ